MKRQILIISVILTLGAGFSEAATTFNVPSPSYPTIQSGIDAAVNGDTVIVANRTLPYTGAGNKNLNFRGKAITVKSAGGAGTCIIDCQGSGRGFGFYTDEGNSSIVQGFTIKNGDADYGGGIDIYYASPTIKHCVIQNCFADFDGGGIACFEQYSSTVKAVIDNCIFINNTTGATSGGGGGINCDGASPTIRNCTFVNCSTAGDGGGIYIYYTANPTIQYNIFSNCNKHAIHEDHINADSQTSRNSFYNNADGDYFDFDTARVYTGAAQLNSFGGNVGNIDGDPLFRIGPFGNFYLSQTLAGQFAQSNCIDKGGTTTASSRGLNTFTTRTDGSSVSGTDSGLVDLGYHYDPCTVRTDITLTMTVAGGLGTISANPAGPTYKQYSEVQVTATPDLNYKVGEWDGIAVNDINDTVTRVVAMTTNKTVTVRFVPRAKYMLTTIVVGGIGGTLTPATGLRNEGNVPLVATPEPGWKVKQWTGTVNDSSLSNNNTVLLDGPKTVTVEFESLLVHLDAVVLGGNGRLRPRSGYYPMGTEVALTATPDCGYRVKRWTGTNNDSLKTRQNTVTMNIDRSVSVEFEVAPIYTLTTTVNTVEGGPGPGTIEPNSLCGTFPSYPDGEVVGLTAVLEEGWQVKQWLGTDSGSNRVTMNGNKHVTLVVEKGPGAVELWWGSTWIAHLREPNNPLLVPKATYTSTPQWPNPLAKAIEDANGGTPEYDGMPDFLYGIIPAVEPAPGDVIVAGDGVYTLSSPLNFRDKRIDYIFNDMVPEAEVWSKHITVLSKNGPENCIIDCQGVTNAFWFHLSEDNNSILEGFTIRNGASSLGLGGGIYVVRGSSPVIRNCIIEDSFAANGGGGIYIEGLDEEDTTFEDAALAAAQYLDGLLFNWDPCTATENDLIRLKTVQMYTDLLTELAADVRDTDRPGIVIDGCKIVNNTTSLEWDAYGGGIYITNASPIIKNTQITGNRGWWGGGIYSELDTSTPAIINCLITENESRDIGGAIYLRGSTATINLCTIAYNTGLDYGDVDPENNNRPFGPKGGIVGRDADAAISNCIIWGNGDDLYEVTATYSCIEDLVDSDDDEGEGNIGINPMFARGPLGNFYLSRIDSGNGIDSPCVDAGEQYALFDLGLPPPDGYSIDRRLITTSIINLPDGGFTDMGFHYPRFTGPDIHYILVIDVDGPGTTIPTPGIYSYIPGTVVTIEAFPAEGYWAYWSGSDNDESFSLTNTVTMYTDRFVEVTFKPIRERVLYVPSQYPRLQDAIDAAEYKDTIVLEASGADNPYRTQQGFVVASKRSLTITSENPDDPAVVAATVIEMTPAASETGGDVSHGFTFADVGPDTVLQGITIRGFDWHSRDGEDADDPLEPGENGNNTWGGAINCGGPVLMGIAELFPRVYMGNASPTIRNCIIEDCNISGGNGGTGAAGSEEHPNGIEGGWPGGAYGGGMSCMWNSSPTVINVTFNNCRVAGGNGGNGGAGNTNPDGFGGRGGGWTYPQSSVVWYGVPWTWAYQGYLTAIRGDGSSFYDFYTEYTGRGGAVFVGEGCSPTFTNCTFTNNRSRGGFVGRCGPDAGGSRQEPSLPWRIDNFGGAVYCDADSSAMFESCLFMNNFADTNRPVRDPNAPISEDNYDNDDEFVGFGGAVAFKYDADVRFVNCLFSQNRGDIGGAAYWADSDPIIADCSFTDNSAQSGGAILLVGGSGKVVRSSLRDNDATSTYGRGGAICALGSDAVVADCQIMGNEAYASGGGIFISSRYVDGTSLVIDGENIFGLTTTSVLNSLIADNIAGRDGGGVSANWLSEPNIINCTITDNVVSGSGNFGYGGGLYGSYDSNCTVINSVIWGNTAPNGNQIAIATADNPSVVDVSYSDVQGGGAYVQNLPGAPATGGQTWLDAGCALIWDAATNLHGTAGSPASEPAFVTGFYGNFYLSQTDTGDANQTIDSPCVDAGTGTADSLPFGRYRYTTRTDDGDDIDQIDMGYHPDKTGTFAPGDLNYDGEVDDTDLAVWFDHWLEECGFPGWCEGADLDLDGIVNNVDFAILTGLYGAGDTIPPEPNPSAWSLVPVSGGPTSITMRAAASADNSGLVVSYYFECTTNPSFSSTWQTSLLYTATGLATGVEYGFRVRAADHNGNMTGWSYIGYAIPSEGGQPADDTTAPIPNPMTWATPPEVNSSTSVRMTATTATDVSGVEYYFDEVSGMPGGSDSVWQNSPIYIDTGLVTGTTYSYRVRARDKSVNHNTTGWSSTVQVTPTSGEPQPTLEAPDVNNVYQVKIGFDWYVNVVAQPGAAALYYRFVCTDSGALSSGWVPQAGPGPLPSGMGTVTYTDGVHYTVAVGPARMTWHFKVCGSNSPTGSGEVVCSGIVTIP